MPYNPSKGIGYQAIIEVVINGKVYLNLPSKYGLDLYNFYDYFVLDRVIVPKYENGKTIEYTYFPIQFQEENGTEIISIEFRAFVN